MSRTKRGGERRAGRQERGGSRLEAPGASECDSSLLLAISVSILVSFEDERVAGSWSSSAQNWKAMIVGKAAPRLSHFSSTLSSLPYELPSGSCTQPFQFLQYEERFA